MRWFDLDTVDELVVTLTRNRVRVGLTALGVGWGTFLLVLMLGFGDGLEEGAQRNMRGRATNAVYIWGRSTYMAYGGFKKGRPVRFQLADRDALQAGIEGIQWVCPRSQLGGWRDGTLVRAGENTGAYQLMGDTPEYRHVQVMLQTQGRWLNQRDLDDYRKVAVLGRAVADELFPGQDDLVGASIDVQGVWFQVVGVFDSTRGDEQGDREASAIHVPLTTFQRVFNQGDRVAWFALVGEPDVDGEWVEERARAVLAAQHAVHPDDRDAMGSRNAAEEFNRMKVLFAGIRLFTWLVGAATLLSGIVGVSDILLITVRERTREIGLRRAIGATPSAVVGMILLESATLTLLAGSLGLLAGVAAVEGLRWYVGPDHASLGQPDLDVPTLLGAMALLFVGGGLSGIVPALRAAAIEPVQALRAE
jgi:putative ABC transport system permease protein